MSNLTDRTSLLELAQENPDARHALAEVPAANYSNLAMFGVNARQGTHTFSEAAMSNLSPFDRLLFERFGQGPVTGVPYTRIHHAFEAYAAVNPQAIAAHHLDDSITYEELNRQANRLAAHLPFFIL